MNMLHAANKIRIGLIYSQVIYVVILIIKFENNVCGVAQFFLLISLRTNDDCY